MNFILDGFFQAINLLITGNAETYSAIFATVRVSSYSIGFSLIVGIPLGFCLGYFDFSGKKSVRTIIDTLMALPTVFIGLLVYAFLTNRGPLGNFGLLFTLPGIAIGQTILALPIVIGLSATAVESMEKKLRITIMSMGANRRQLFLTMFMGIPAWLVGRCYSRIWACHDGSGDLHDGWWKHQMAHAYHYNGHRIGNEQRTIWNGSRIWVLCF